MSSMVIQRKLAELRHAAWGNDLNVIKDLLQSIEDEAFTSDGGEAMATDDGHQQHYVKDTDYNSCGALHCAASMANLEALQSILAANVCDVDEVDKDGNTALMWAISHACTSPSTTSTQLSSSPNSSSTSSDKSVEMELIEALVDHGANVNKANFEGETPLSIAVKLGCVDKVAYLIENGADPNAKDITSATPLHYAASLGLDTIAALLLRNGAFLNQRDEWDECALHWAVREGGEGAMRIVKMLSDRGAVLDIYNDDGETPLDLALETGDERMVNLLLSLGALGSNFDSMAISTSGGDASSTTTTRSFASEEQKVAEGSLLGWTAEASQVMRACERSLTHLVA